MKEKKFSNIRTKPNLTININDLDSIFQENSYPTERYMIKGDKKNLHEIKTEYLKKILDKSGQFPKLKSVSCRYLKSVCLDSINNNNYISTNSNTYSCESSTDKALFIHPVKSSRTRPKRSKINVNTTNKITEEDEINSAFSDDEDLKSNDVKVQKAKKEKGIMSREESEEFLLDLYVQGVTNTNPFSLSKVNSVPLTPRQKEVFKLEDDNPYLYSFTNLHQFSMFYGTKYPELFTNKKKTKDNSNIINYLKLPAPRFISNDDWRKEEDYSYKEIFKKISINEKLGLVIKDPIYKKKFSGLLKDILIQILKVPFGHHISLNVKIFEPKTVLGRYTGVFSFANRLLIPASDPKVSTYERFKSVVTFLVSGMYVPVEQLKPFNPFVGETYQAEFPNGAKLYVENVTHTPLSERFLLIYKKIYEISGYWNLSVKAGSFGSEMFICSKGPVYIRFPQLNECIAGHIPEVKIVNATSENDRALRYIGNQVFVDVKNSYKAVVLFDSNKSQVFELKGNTMKYNYPKDYVYSYEQEWKYGQKFKVDDYNNKKYEIIETIKGNWIQGLYIGDDHTWDVNKHTPEYLRPVKNCIPSDGKFREDLIWLYRSFYCARSPEEETIYRYISQEWKIMMEEFNRWERKNRNDLRKKLKSK